MDARHVNPYIAGSPVTGTEMFYGRQDVFQFIRRNLIGAHQDTPVVIYGQRRTGKTSVLYQLHRHLDKDYRCVFIDMHGLNLDGMANLLLGIANGISRSLRRDHQLSIDVPAREAFQADPRSAFEGMFLDKLWPAIGQDHLVLMLDEVIRIDEEVRAERLERGIFDYLRHLMQHYNRLSFIFSLGSGLEEMTKDYAFLFSVALYHRISFLEPAAAMELVNQPARGCYELTPEAVGRILQITSGHPYYTQLVCHCVFDRWSRSPQDLMSVNDVEAVLPEAIELGSANLTYVWEDSNPGEKAVMAAVAAATSNSVTAATMEDVTRAWAGVGVSLPKAEAVRSMRSLVAREVFSGDQACKFTVDLQRLWLDRHRRLDWVKDEISDAVGLWGKSVTATISDTPDSREDGAGTEDDAASTRHLAQSIAVAQPRAGWSGRYVTIALAVVAVIAIYIAAAAAAKVFPFSSPAPASASGIAPGITNLLPGGLNQEQSECHPGSPPKNWSATGLQTIYHCTDPTLKGGEINLYGMRNDADVQATLRSLNKWLNFPDAHIGATCPPAGTTQAMEYIDNSAVPQSGRSLLECGEFLIGNDESAPAYIWYYPVYDAIVIAQGRPGSSISALAYWTTHQTLQKNSS
jgi:ATPase domain predominantly from Archaea